MRSHRTTGALALGLGLLLVTTLGLGTTAAAGSPDPRTTAVSTDAARAALADARDALHGRAGHPTRDATLALRDLQRALPGLRGADRAAAESILKRPTDPGDQDQYSVPAETLCGTIICLHWVESSVDTVPLADTAPADGTPDYVALVLSTMEAVHTTYVAAGYRGPEPDGTNGGDARTDVYLADIGTDGLYGYCSSDEPVVQDKYDYWAYCVLDNDYSPTEFGSTNTPIENMQVTAAHEYFHAVQAAYDWYEDSWLMEGTATWAEDEVFDDVDDNIGYLPSGQLGVPWRPLDDGTGMNVYGNWIFFRFLTEQIPAETGTMPTLVRTIWENADSTHGATNDQYSLQAIANALSSAGYPFPVAYASFVAANRQPRNAYEEGAANQYAAAPLSYQPVTLSPSHPGTTWGEVTQGHLTSDTVRFKPSSKMKASSWRLKVQVDLAPKSRGSMAVVSVFRKNGTSAVQLMGLNSKGDGSLKVPFSSRSISSVELSVINASQRTDCWQYPAGTAFSCYGIPKDDNLKQRFRGVASN